MATTDSTAVPEAPALRHDTMCAVLLDTLGRRTTEGALRSSDGSLELSYEEMAERVRRIAAGLRAIGVRRGDTVALMLRNRPEFHLVDIAAMCLGATPFSLYNTSPPEQLGYVMGDAGNKVVVTEPMFADVLARSRDHGARFETVVLVEGEATGGALTLADVEERGEDGFDLVEASREVQPGDLLTLIYTSGTTGPPKGVELTHANLLAELRGVHDAVPQVDGGRTISFLPAAHIADRWSSHYGALMTYGHEITCVADPTQLMPAVQQLRPTMFGGVPRIWEKIKAALEAKAGGMDLAAAARADEGVGAMIREQLGVEQSRWFVVGAAPTPLDVLEFFDALGIRICEVWGMSELSCIATTNRPDAWRAGSVGLPLAGVELRLADDDELLVRGDIVMRGYRNMPDRTAETIDDDGWLHTGDVARVDDDGYWWIVDRKKELIINAAGKNMSPANIESHLKSAGPLIGQACVVGDRRPYNVALLVLDPDTGAGLDPTDPEVVARVQAEVDAANAVLSRVEQVKRFALLDEEWLPGGDELTPTMKLKRKPIAAKYGALIDDLYAA
jgi:long-subunit acyl-CoA synthetase (AMP-forming)